MLAELWLSSKYLKAGKKEKIISVTALISMLGIAVGVMVLIVVISVMSGFGRFLEDKMVGANSHLLVDFYRGTGDLSGVLAKLEAAPHVLAAAPYVAGQGFIKSANQVTAVELRGVDPALQPKVSKIREYLRKGTLDIRGNEAVIGEELAYRLGLAPGGTLSVISPANLQKTDFTVKGVFASGMYLYDSALVLTSLQGAQDFYKLPGQVNGFALKLDDIYNAELIKDDVYRSLGGGQYEVRTWIDANRSFLNALKLEKIVMFVVVTMTTVVAAFGIASTLIMSVMTKIKDIGILRSVGAATRSVLEIFVFQGLRIGVAGILLGLAGGLILSRSLNRIADFISGLVGRNIIPQDIYYFSRIPTYISPLDLMLIVTSSLGICLLASIYPAYYASRISPGVAVRHE